MAAWTEIERFRKDAAGARDLARWLSRLEEREAFSEWEADFLLGLQEKTYLDELSTRQAEKLLEIRDDVELVSKHQGFSIERLVQGCHEGRLDLAEEDEDWICGIHATSFGSIRRKHLNRLFRCARQLGLIDDR